MQILGDRVTTFLDSIGRNSKNSQNSYANGLRHFDKFLQNSARSPSTLETIIPSLTDGKINVYELLDQFVSYLTNQPSISNSSLKFYLASVRSFLEFHDIDISISKFKRRVKTPKLYKEEEQPVDLEDIRRLLGKCDNSRLRAFILLLTSAGLRAIEGCSLRLQDVDFTSNPTRITVRKEYSKTKRSRIIYCSDEATEELQTLLKFRRSNSDLIFALRNDTKSPKAIYVKLLQKFNQVQEKADRDQRKDNSRRRKITFHSFRRTCFSIISENVSSEFAHWFIGHDHSVYWTWKEPERRKIYATKCIPSLIIADYRALDTRSKNIEVALKEKDRELLEMKRQMADMQQAQKEMQTLLQHPKELLEMINEGNS